MIELDRDIIKTNILTMFEEDLTNNVALECKQDFSKIWPSDLHSNPTQPMITFDWNIIKINILSKFEEDWEKNVAPRV